MIYLEMMQILYIICNLNVFIRVCIISALQSLYIPISWLTRTTFYMYI